MRGLEGGRGRAGLAPADAPARCRGIEPQAGLGISGVAQAGTKVEAEAKAKAEGKGEAEVKVECVIEGEERR